MIKIIPYTNKYKNEVIELILNVYENELNFRGFKRPDIYKIPDFYQKDKNSNFWIALDDNELVGTVGLHKKTNDLVHIKRMIVKKEYRKRGLGTKLLQTILQFAKDHKFKKIYAGTVKENPNAIKFYKKHGFVLSKDIPDDITAAPESICLKLDL